MNIEEVVNKIISIVNSLRDISNINGNELSEKALLLGIYKAYVGQKLVSLEYDLANCKMVRKTEWGKVYFDADGTVEIRKIIADREVKNLVIKEIELEKSIGTLKNLRADVSDVTSLVQTRLSQLRSEVFESK